MIRLNCFTFINECAPGCCYCLPLFPHAHLKITPEGSFLKNKAKQEQKQKNKRYPLWGHLGDQVRGPTKAFAFASFIGPVPMEGLLRFHNCVLADAK